MIDRLQALHENSSAQDILKDALSDFNGRIALVSSFGIEASVLLHMVSRIDPATPVLFIDTGKHFGETLRYRDRLVKEFGLTDLRVIGPSAEDVAQGDADGVLWNQDADACCHLRKVQPLAKALSGFEAWINGRKGLHGGSRAAMPFFEADGPRVKVTPLARWSQADLDAYRADNSLPAHPLEEDGFTSVGCLPCSQRNEAGGDPRAGRWAGTGKTECGIHTRLQAALAVGQGQGE